MVIDSFGPAAEIVRAQNQTALLVRISLLHLRQTTPTTPHTHKKGANGTEQKCK